jgi:hypothetical protein
MADVRIDGLLSARSSESLESRFDRCSMLQDPPFWNLL